MAVSMVFQTLYYLVDLYFVSRLGKEAIAGVGLAGNLMLVVLALTQMLGVGTTVLISHAAGQKDQPRAQMVFNQSFVLALSVGTTVIILGYVFRMPYSRWLGADALTVRDGAAYLLWFIPALGLQFALVSMASALRGTGIVKPTMIVQVLTVVINILLAPVLIAGWGTHHPLGVKGASLATLVAIAIGALAITAYFVKLETYVSFDRSMWSPQVKIWRQMLNIGLPASGEFALMGVYVGLVYWIIRDFGARQPERVRQTFYSAAGIGLAAMLGLTLVCQMSPATLIRIFSREPQVIAFGTDYLRIISWNFMAMGLIFTSGSIFQALGNTWPSLGSSCLWLLIFAAPAAALSMRPGFTIREVWYLSVATVTVQALSNLTLLRREFRRKLTFSTPPPIAQASVAGELG